MFEFTMHSTIFLPDPFCSHEFLFYVALFGNMFTVSLVVRFLSFENYVLILIIIGKGAGMPDPNMRKFLTVY